MKFSRKLFWIKKRFSWNYKYFIGKWDYIENQNTRYNKIVEHVNYCNINNPKILDLGCGFGSLCKYLNEDDFSSLLGVDLSDTAIAKAKKKKYSNTNFIVADIQKFETNEKFDIIILNEVIYYLDDYLETLSRFSKFFKNENGYFIISIYGVREDIIEKVSTQYELIKTDKVLKVDNNAYWGITLFKYNKHKN
ncbi:class I SAM-dependent methyltransferase [Flavobacterium sp.]|uniref:class I SAM-dependent methyltransferase n=1 Tax=Flavobacterium sp. TaxID=239 RepID=UPI002635136D|nr:class I SAM-dependent methyltransferase [Flavobacterium sp.]